VSAKKQEKQDTEQDRVQDARHKLVLALSLFVHGSHSSLAPFIFFVNDLDE
jgi:hypothetical protein